MSTARTEQRGGLPVSPSQREELARLARRYRLRMVVAFGSAVTGKTHPRSDLDLAVLPEAGVEFSVGEWLRLWGDLDRILAPWEVDLADLARADPLFLRKVFETAVLLYGDEREFRWYRVYAFRRFSEYLPYLRLEVQATRKLVARLRDAG